MKSKGKAMKLYFSVFGWCLALLILTCGFLLGATGDTGWQLLNLRFHSGCFYRASSELNAPTDNDFGSYGMYRLFDDNLKTCWAEGAEGSGIGESLYLTIDEGTNLIDIANGYQKSPALFKANNRIKTLEATIFVGINPPGEVTELFTTYHARMFFSSEALSLTDTSGFQQVPLSIDWKSLQEFKDRTLEAFSAEKNIETESYQPDVRYILRLRITDVYPGEKYNDTCISEIKTECTKNAPDAISVKSVYLNPAENTILMDTETEEKIVLDSDSDAVFQIVELSPDKQWLIVIKMPAEIGDSRAETTYLLYNTHLKMRVPQKLLGPDVSEFYDFSLEGDSTYLDYLNGKTMSIESLDLGPVYKAFNDLQVKFPK